MLLFFMKDLGVRNALRVAMRGKFRSPTRGWRCGRNALVQRHARLAPDNLARCVLAPLSSRRRACGTSLYLPIQCWERKMCRRKKQFTVWTMRLVRCGRLFEPDSD